MYEIEKGVERVETRGAKAKYPFRKMDVGDSFFVPDAKIESIRSTSRYVIKTTKRRFSIVQQEGGVRVWRVK